MTNNSTTPLFDSRSESCLGYLENHNFKSFDFYDGLLSPLSKLAVTNLTKRVLIQFVKRSPPIIRTLLRIQKTQMAVTMANALEASIVSQGVTNTLNSVLLAEEILKKQNADGGWGYEFDATLRWGSYPKGSSNIIATYFCTKALTFAGIEGEWKHRAKEFVIRLHCNGYFRYTEASSVLIHNANYLGAATLAYLGGEKELISSALATSAMHQKHNGSWEYGIGPKLHWIDNFHTCYILIALKELEKYGFRDELVFERGLEFWLKHLSLPNGPFYFFKDKYPTSDINTYACSLQLASELYRSGSAHKEQLSKLIDYRFALVNLLNQDGSPEYAFRWKVAPAAIGLAYAFRALGNE